MKIKRKKRSTTRHPAECVITDNIATQLAPVWRARIATPLTPGAVRAQILEASQDIPETERVRWLQRRRTQLDKLLTEDEATVLERWCAAEERLNGSARTADITGDRVQTSRSQMAPLHDDELARLGWHAAIKRTIAFEDTTLLTIFRRQMARDREVMTPAQVGIYLFPNAQNKRVAYFEALQRIAQKLITANY